MIQTLRFSPREFLILFTDHPRLAEYVLSKNGILRPSSRLLVRSADNSCARHDPRSILVTSQGEGEGGL